MHKIELSANKSITRRVDRSKLFALFMYKIDTGGFANVLKNKRMMCTSDQDIYSDIQNWTFSVCYKLQTEHFQSTLGPFFRVSPGGGRGMAGAFPTLDKHLQPPPPSIRADGNTPNLKMRLPLLKHEGLFQDIIPRKKIKYWKLPLIHVFH